MGVQFVYNSFNFVFHDKWKFYHEIFQDKMLGQRIKLDIREIGSFH